jgi:putative sigma-54 modulation protein
MNVTYTGKQENLHQKHKDQIDSKLSKIGKLLDVDGKSQKSARVVLAHDKNMHRAEVTIRYLDHTVVGEHVDADQFTALTNAIERVERQILKLRDKRREPKGPRESWEKGGSTGPGPEAEPREPAPPASNGRPKVFRVQPADGKPLTEEEAVLVIESDEQYLVYRDARTQRLSVLLRRSDGNFDLVEC